MTNLTLDQQMSLIKRGTVEIIREEELKEKLKKSIQDKKPLIIKAGFDPTAPDIHLGHTVLIRKLRHFQELGHKVIFLIGDATALVGDPSGRSLTRKVLTWDEVKQNAVTYEKQVSKILDINNPALFERRHNSEWFDPVILKKGRFTFDFFVGLAQRYTVARLLERDDFQKRLKDNKPISFLELFYPLMQGYDSVELEADVELGGTDQKFNMLVGRNLQQAYETYSKPAQVVITMPLLEGTDGVNKMSKSLGNYIGINDTPKEIFGKIMSISDQLMMRYYELLTDEDMNALKKALEGATLHPKEAKKALARYIISQYYSNIDAIREDEDFEKAFKNKQFPDNISLTSIKVPGGQPVDLVGALALLTGESKGEVKRKIKEGAVEVNGAKVQGADISIAPGQEYKIRIGKRFFRAVFE